MFEGEFLSICVSVSWTLTAICMEYASLKMCPSQTNFIRLFLASIMMGCLLLVMTGNFFPVCASPKTWLWMGLSGFIGLFLGDFCLYKSYVIIGARFGQLFLTLSPIITTLTAFIFLQESMGILKLVAIIVTISGVAMSIYSRELKKFKLPLSGILLGLGAAIGQGLGFVCSKYGMTLYYDSIPQGSELIKKSVPFAAGMIRMLVAMVCFFILLLFMKRFSSVIRTFRDGKYVLSVVTGSFFGPLLGVSLSLMALEYVQSGVVVTLTSLPPVLIIPYTLWIQKQKITKAEVLGAFISVFGVSLFFI